MMDKAKIQYGPRKGKKIAIVIEAMRRSKKKGKKKTIC